MIKIDKKAIQTFKEAINDFKSGGYGDAYIITTKENEDAYMKRMCDLYTSVQVGLNDTDIDLQSDILFNRFPKELTNFLSRNFGAPDRFVRKSDNEIIADFCSQCVIKEMTEDPDGTLKTTIDNYLSYNLTPWEMEPEEETSLEEVAITEEDSDLPF